MEQGGEGGEVRERVGPAEIKAEQDYLVLTHTLKTFQCSVNRTLLRLHINVILQDSYLICLTHKVTDYFAD